MLKIKNVNLMMFSLIQQITLFNKNKIIKLKLKRKKIIDQLIKTKIINNFKMIISFKINKNKIKQKKCMNKQISKIKLMNLY